MIIILAEDTDRIRPLMRELKALRAPFRLLHAGRAIFDLSQPPPPPGTVVYNRASPSARKRHNPGATAFAQVMIEWYDLQGGATVLNGHRALVLETSHAVQVAACRAHGIRTPHSILVHDPELAVSAARAARPDLPINPLLAGVAHRGAAGPDIPKAMYLKPDCGGSSIDVRRCTNLRNVQSGAKAITDPNQLLVVQEEIHGANALLMKRSTRNMDGRFILDMVDLTRITFRLEFIDAKPLYVLRIVSSGMTRDLCPCADKDNDMDVQFSVLPHTTPPHRAISEDVWRDFAHRCESVVKRYQLFTAAFEFAIDAEGEPTVFDVNVNTNYNELAETRAHVPNDLRGYPTLARAIVAKLTHVPAPSRRRRLQFVEMR